MKKSMKFAAALAGAAVVVVGGSAFTDGNEMPVNPVGGSGTLEVSGVTVASATYEYDAAHANLKTVAFTMDAATPDLGTGYINTLTAKAGAATLEKVTCSTTPYNNTTHVLTCDFGATTAPIATLDSLVLTVTENATT